MVWQTIQNGVMNLKELENFLVKANKPHADGTAKMKNESDNSRSIEFELRDYRMHDNFFGGEPYGGRQVIFYKGKPVWMCVYYGQVHNTGSSSSSVYAFLRLALQHPENGKPYRGPDNFSKGEFEYKNKVEGAIDSFSGEEYISKGGKQIYWAKYFGGLVDQRDSGSY